MKKKNPKTNKFYRKLKSTLILKTLNRKHKIKTKRERERRHFTTLNPKILIESFHYTTVLHKDATIVKFAHCNKLSLVTKGKRTAIKDDLTYRQCNSDFGDISSSEVVQPGRFLVVLDQALTFTKEERRQGKQKSSMENVKGILLIKSNLRTQTGPRIRITCSLKSIRNTRNTPNSNPLSHNGKKGLKY